MHPRACANRAPKPLVASAALIAAFVTGCTGAEPAATSLATPAPTATPPSDATSPATPTASPSAAATATSSARPIALDVEWTVDFGLTAPADWSTTEVHETLGGTTTAETLWIAAGQRFVTMTLTGPDTVQAWLDKLAATEQLEATEPVEVSLGGSPGYRVDLVVSEEASESRCANNGRCYTLFQDASGYWPVVEGRPTAAWIVEVDGEALMIATDSRENSFAEWAMTVEEVLATIEWR